MVEKIRESYQKHSRNISAVSDISVSLAEPLKRDAEAEIRCIWLCDSETERNCVFEAIREALCDGMSGIENPQVLQHHWEQPHVECLGAECRYCFRLSVPQNASELSMNHHNVNGFTSNHASFEGFFRFSVRGTIFRLMLLSKDRQNLLKIYSFDFLAVCMQVTNTQGHLDEHIWEFEWKRIERHSKKAVSPIILLGYFRGLLKLGHGEMSLKKIVEDAKNRSKKVGRSHHAIPRFCDFVTGNSIQLCKIFRDIEKLYRHPGFVLQQCAHINNRVHFTKIIENPHVTEEDVQYQGDDPMGDTPIMIAAKLRHKDLVSAVLRSPRFHNEADGNEFLRELIHTRNTLGQTLLSMVALQGPELEEQKLLILQKEIQIHCVSELTHDADQLKLQRCLRGQLKSSAEAAIILEQSRALQGIPKTERELKAESGKVWSRLFFASLLLSLLFQVIDTGSDILIMIRYYGEMAGGYFDASNNTCGDEAPETEAALEELQCDYNYTNSGMSMSIQCFPKGLSPEQKFGYTLFFILVPWPFFIYEFFTSRQYQQMVAKGGQILADFSRCDGIRAFISAYMKAIIYCILFLCCFLFWPIAVLFIKYYNDGKYYLAKGAQKAEREKKIEASEVLYSTARVMEVSLESSFQPTIQLYILFPVLVRTMTASSFSLKIFTVCKNESLNFPMLKMDQTISIITSILSLAWCFTFYHATLKRGALDKDLAALFYRGVLFLSVLFQIIGRLFILVLFSYSFGPGMYFPVLIFLGVHILLMTTLHFVFSDAKKYWQKGGFLNLSFFHYMIGNGLANIYIHNWIRMDPLLITFSKPLQHVSTLVRQLVFDIIFAAENVVLLAIALNANITELQENQLSFAVILLGFTLVGLILKCVYYRYLHIWAWLIMDYITKKEDGHWKCILFSNMYLCGDLKERELLLCCIPKPLFKCFSFLCGERPGTSFTVCGTIVTVLILPFAVLIGLFVLTFLIVLAVIFVPFFLAAILPCVVYLKCRHNKDNDNIIKIVDDNSKEGFLLIDQMARQVSAETRKDEEESEDKEEEVEEEEEDKGIELKCNNSDLNNIAEVAINNCTKV